MAVVYSRHDLSEEVSGVALRDPLLLTDVVVQVASARVLHHDHNLVLVLEHCETTQTQAHRWSHKVDDRRAV